jgi:iron complex outermembrane receptor protein
VTALRTINGTPANVTDNAANAEIRGLEIEAFAAPVENLELGMSLTYLDATYRDYLAPPVQPGGPVLDFSGNSLINSPKLALSMSATYTLPVEFGELRLRGDYYYTDEQAKNASNADALTAQSYSLVNLRLSFEEPSRRFEIAAFVSNLFEQEYVTNAQSFADQIGIVQLFYGEPRTFGVTLTARLN